MAEKNWFTDNAPKAASGQDWFASNAPKQEIPDATAQAHQSDVQRAKNVIQPTIQDPRGAATREFSARNPNEKLKEHFKESAVVSGGMLGGELVAPLAAGAEEVGGASQILKWLLPRITRASGAGVGSGGAALITGSSPKEALATGSKVAATELGTEAAISGGAKVVKALSTKVDPLAKINKLLGAGAREIRVGKVPASLDELASNPARGVTKSGLDEAKLSKMDPLERNRSVTSARDAAGRELEASLKSATDAGKTVNIQKSVEDIFKSIPDKKLAKQTEARLSQILQKNKITKPLSQLTPTEARAIQRDLDDFANFASEGAVKTFRDVATQLRRSISAETRRVVPESAPLDQHYGDLANAVKATQKTVNKFARTVPENKLRKWIIRAAAGGAGVGGAYEAGKHMRTFVP